VKSGDNAIEANPSTTDENAEVSSGGRPIARRERSDSFGSLYGHPALTRAAVIETAQEFGYGRSPPAKGTRDSFNMAFSPTGPEDSTHGTANPITHHSRSKSAQNKRKSVSPPDESSRLTNGSQPISYAAVVKKSTKTDDNGHDHDHSHDHANGKKHSHSEDHSEAEAGGHSHGGGGHGHSHGNMNAQGVFLHVLGDA
jgi:zinc transporter 1